jgi:hypothetical protein
MPAPEVLKDFPKIQELVDGPGYSEASDSQVLDPVRLELGRLTDISYENRFKRPTLWQVHGDRIEYYAPIELKKDEDPPPYETPADLRRHGVKVEHIITAEQLASKPIPEEAAKTLLIFKRVEDNLPWFTLSLSQEWTDVKGLNRGASQWSREEAEHSNVAGLILKSAPIITAEGEIKPPLMTQEEIDRDYEETQLNIWKPPFGSSLEDGLAYPYEQEMNTNGNYIALRDIVAQYNIHAAYAIGRVGKDESWHAGYYKDGLVQAYKVMPEETIKAVARATWNFRMPSMALMRDRVKDTDTVIKTIGYNRPQIERMLRRALTSLSFFPREFIEPIVTNYFDEEAKRVKSKMYKLMREQVEAQKKDRENGKKDISTNGSNGASGDIFVANSETSA